MIHFYNMIEWATCDKIDFQESVEYQHRIRRYEDRKNTTERQSKMNRFTYDERAIVKKWRNCSAWITIVELRDKKRSVKKKNLSEKVS